MQAVQKGAWALDPQTPVLRRSTVVIMRLLSLMALIGLVASTGCARSPRESKRIAFTSIVPQRDFVQRIAGERFEVYALAGAGQSPHSYTATPDQMARLSDASLFFRIGVEFEEGVLPKIKKSMPNLRLIDLRKGITLRQMDAEHAHDNDLSKDSALDSYLDHDDHDNENGHGDQRSDTELQGDSDHHQDGSDPHIWLSPRLVKQMGETIRDALIEADPQGAETYQQNLVRFHHDLDSLDDYMRQTLGPLKGSELFVFHPAFGYLASDYGLIQKPVETGGKEPSARALARLIEQARLHKPRVIFVQPQYALKSAESLASQIGCAVVPINPLPENYFDEMRQMCLAIQKGLGANE